MPNSSNSSGAPPPDGIKRQDSVNGNVIATGGTEVASSSPVAAATSAPNINADPRGMRGGNIPATFNIAHLIRDKRLSFSNNTVTVAVGTRDNLAGSYDISDDGDSYDVVIVGAGMAGLAAAFFLSRQKPDIRILMLDANPLPGGNAGRDDAPPLPGVCTTGGAYCVTPYIDFLEELYEQLGIDWTRYYVPAPFYNYYFDSQTPYVTPGARGWNIDSYERGLQSLPYAPEIVRDIHQSKQDFRNWYARHNSPTDPADNADPRFDYLAGITLDQYLTEKKGYHPAVSDFYTRYTIDALAGTTKQVNAFNGISFIGAEFNPIFVMPGGTSGVARLLVNWLVPGTLVGTNADQQLASPLRSAQLDDPQNRVRIRPLAVAARVENHGNSANCVYWKDGKFHRATAKAAIIATQSHSAWHLVEDSLTPAVRTAWQQFTQVPVVVANVALRSAASLVQLGLGYDSYYWGSQYWADFVIADWVSESRNDPQRQTTLTFFGGNSEPPEKMVEERWKIMNTPFSSYEKSLRDDMNRVLADGGFDFDRDVAAVFVYRWGHGMVYPKVGFPFGPPTEKQGRAVRTPAPRHIARQQLGRISFAGQDTESSPAIESAIGSGLRTANEVLALL